MQRMRNTLNERYTELSRAQRQLLEKPCYWCSAFAVWCVPRWMQFHNYNSLLSVIFSYSPPRHHFPNLSRAPWMIAASRLPLVSRNFPSLFDYPGRCNKPINKQLLSYRLRFGTNWLRGCQTPWDQPADFFTSRTSFLQRKINFSYLFSEKKLLKCN